MTLYLDANATTPIEPRVRDVIMRCFEETIGNAGSPHRFGRDAKQVVHHARDQIANVVGARRHEVIFTSGATESNNLAILGLVPQATATGRRHIVSTQIEHKAVLEPLQVLAQNGFEVTFVPPQSSGAVLARDILQAVRDDTLLVTMMHVNNETGVVQPIEEVADQLPGDGVLLHVDAAQGYGKQSDALRHARIDLMSVSSHKIHGPQGVGALIARRRAGVLPPLQPLMHGGGQEFGLRPGTLPVPLIAGFGMAAELAEREAEERAAHCAELKQILLRSLEPIDCRLHGDERLTLSHVVNLSVAGMMAEELIETLDEIAAVSDGAACTSVCATASHVLAAMKVDPAANDGAIRISWSHLTTREQMQSTGAAMRRVLPSHT